MLRSRSTGDPLRKLCAITAPLTVVVSSVSRNRNAWNSNRGADTTGRGQLNRLSAEELGTTNPLQRLKFLAGLESNGLARWNRNLGSGARIPADARLARTNIEDPEAAQLNALAVCQRALHAFEDGLHRHLGLGLRYTGPVHNFIDDIELYQDILPLDEWLNRSGRYQTGANLMIGLGLTSCQDAGS